MCACSAAPLKFEYVSFHFSVAPVPFTTYVPVNEPVPAAFLNACFGTSCFALSDAVTLNDDPAAAMPTTTSAAAAAAVASRAILPSMCPPSTLTLPGVVRRTGCIGLRRQAAATAVTVRPTMPLWLRRLVPLAVAALCAF